MVDSLLHVGKSIRHIRNPRMRAHRVDNNEMALAALKSMGIIALGYDAQGNVPLSLRRFTGLTNFYSFGRRKLETADGSHMANHAEDQVSV